MDFAFDEDSLLFQRALRDFLATECTPERIRSIWSSESGRCDRLWAQLTEIGLPGLEVDEALGGLGRTAIDGALLHEELGRAACAEPLISTSAVAAPLLRALGDAAFAEPWLRRIAAGEARAAIACELSPFVADAHVADLLLVWRGDELHALTRAQVHCTPQPANDPSRRLFTLDWEPSAATRRLQGAAARAALSEAIDRGALAAAAQQLGVCDRLISMASLYAQQRKQFGKPIGGFQAIKHLLANCKVKLEYARPAVQRASHSVAHGHRQRSLHVSMAKLLASEAAQHAARVALQVHGALGYTWEQDLHLWMRRAWSLEQAFGRNAWHRARAGAVIFSAGAELGPGTTF